MRLWSLHPKYLDRRGLVALWRETLLAQAVLTGKTKGYRNHPQLVRFAGSPSPVGAIAEYLRGVHAESVERGYQFNFEKINPESGPESLPVTRGQLQYEWDHLVKKVQGRDPEWAVRLEPVVRPHTHPFFHVVPGKIEDWERVPDLERE